MGKRLLASAVALLLLMGAPAMFAQSNTAGSVTGDVKDGSGGALPGVTVELSGAAMQGTRSVVTDASGSYRFVNVPPGDNYKVTAALSGFQPTSKTISRVYLGQEATVELTLRQAVTESITVTAEAPLVDVSKTTTGVNVTSRQFESLPTQRSFQQLTTMAPGVEMNMSDTRNAQLGNSPNVGASSAPENNYIIDGLSTTDVRYGTSGTNLTMNFVEEVQVMTGGYSAEYGRSTGGVFNVITKSGGNDFHGDVFGYYSKADWASKNVSNVQRGTAVESSSTDSRDLGLSIGGPIAKDKLWFFGAFNPSHRTTHVGQWAPPLGDQPTQYTRKTNFYAGKLTWAASANHNFVLTTFGDPTKEQGWLIRGINATPALVGSATRHNDIGSNNINARYTGVLSQQFLGEVSVGRHKRNNNLGPDSEIGRTVPRQIDETNSKLQMGGFQRNQSEKSGRDAYTAKLTNYFGPHELRYGLDVEKNSYVASTHETWYRYFGGTRTSRLLGACASFVAADPNNACDQVQERIYSVDGSGKTQNSAAFLQDQWKVTSNLQFSLGLRYEEQKMSSARGVYLAANAAQAADATLAKHVGSYTMKNNWAPRLGVIFDPQNNGRSKIYAYAGRFFEAVPLDLNIRALNGEDYIINDYQHLPGAPLYWYNPSGNPIPAPVRTGARGTVTDGGWTKYRVRNLTGVDVITAIASDLKAQYQDEYILGGERQFADVWSIGARVVDRELKRVIEDFGVFSDPTDPTALTGYGIGNPGQGRLGGGTGPNAFPKPKRYYRAAEFTVQRAFKDNWQLYASYVYARARGNYEGLFVSGYEQLDPNITALYDLPSFLNNADGKLRADKPAQIKIHSSYSFPMGLTISEGFYYSSGIPISALGPDISNGYGDGTIFLKPRGTSGRTPNYYNLDIHGDYTLPWHFASSKISAIVDVFNVTNQHKALEADTDYIYQGIVAQQGAKFAPWFADANLDKNGEPVFNASLPPSKFFGTGKVFQAPRYVQVGLRVTY